MLLLTPKLAILSLKLSDTSSSSTIFVRLIQKVTSGPRDLRADGAAVVTSHPRHRQYAFYPGPLAVHSRRDQGGILVGIWPLLP